MASKAAATVEAPVAEPVPSKYASDRTPAGWSVEGGECGVIAGAYNTLLADRKAAAQAVVPPAVDVKLKAAVLTADGYQLVSRGVVSGIPTFQNARPTRRDWSTRGPELLDSFFEGGAAWVSAPDLEVWSALQETAAFHGFKGRALRQLSDAVALGVLLRAGLVVQPYELPNIGA